MTGIVFEIQLIAVVVAVACALPGVFLVLRRTAMLSDAISHAILLGIVLAFFVARDLSSPLLIVGAAATGILTVTLVELLTKTRLVKEDAAIGLVFPALFSLGVILIARYAGDVHLDTDSVLLGELAFAPLNRLVLFGADLGPKSLYEMMGILVMGLAFILVFYKELKLSSFDAGLAVVLGFSPAALHYALMALVSVTAVGAFDAVGSVLVVALMIAPPATAYLLTDRLAGMLVLSAATGVASAIGGFWMAYLFDVSIAGAMATATGLCFLCAYLWAPERGLVAVARRRRRQRWEFAETMLAIHLHQHEDRPEAATELREDHLVEHLAWTAAFAGEVVRRAERNGTLVRRTGLLALTPPGRKLAREALVR
jgi:manganese/zinc/iron transport system permease protein